MKIRIVRPTGIFLLTGRMEYATGTREHWGIEMRATTSKGTTISSNDELLLAHRREIVASFESARWVCERYGRKYKYP